MAKEFIVYSKTKAEFEALVSSGEVDTSQMGIIAETGEMWWNGEYRPIAETVPFANDLTGRIEATPEEFTFRPSAGDKSIRDDSALIKKIKGNTIVWNQGVNNAVNNSLYGKTAWYVRQGTQNAEIVGNYVVINCVSGESSVPLLSQIVNFKKNHKYLIHLRWESTTEIDSYGRALRCEMNNDIIGGTPVDYFTAVSSLNTLTGDKYIIKTAVDDAKYLVIGPRKYTNDIGQYLKISVNLFDLTQMFGSGNEPTTVEEFKALFPNDYYDYNAGELVSMTSNGLFANGFNQWDEEWVLGGFENGSFISGSRICSKNFIEIVPNQVYTSNKSLLISLYDSEKNFIPYDGNGDFPVWGNCVDFALSIIKEGKFPAEAKFIKFGTYSSYGSTTYKNDICINLAHTGVRNGEYEPYWDATKDLSIIQKYFPNGMRSAGSIYDEISFDEATQKWVAIQRVGSVDLGSLTWSKHDTYANTFFANIYDLFTENAPTKVRNLLCSKYEVVSRYTQTSESTDKTISANNAGGSNRVFVIDTSYTDATAFKAAMSGVMLYYELAEPIITTIEEPVDLSYKVGDFGIEKMLSDSFSAPFKADIIYQFNATDRVRENSMNISKLSKKHTLLESEVDALESKALTTEEQNFSNDQKAQVATNLGGNTTNGLVRYVGGNLPVQKISAPDANGVEQTYVLPNASDDVKASATGGVLATEDTIMKFSNDLTGRIEATPEEFTFRPSAGDKSIRDESAVMRSIKGNTIVWNQLINITSPVNIDFTNDTTQYYQILGRLNKGIRIIKEHKYIGTGYVKTNITTRISFGISPAMGDGIIMTSYGTGYYENIFKAPKDSDSNILYINNYQGQQGFFSGDYVNATLNLFDLTQMFGAGNEPTTVEEFKALFPDSYYPYCEPELRSVTTKAIETVGFNQWDEEWEEGMYNINTGEKQEIFGIQVRSKNYIKVLPNTDYFFDTPNDDTGWGWVIFYDEDKNFISSFSIHHNIRTTPANASFATFHMNGSYGTTYNNDICINLSHSGVRNGEYQPYEKHTRELPEIAKYFPNCMRSAGSIYDEISFDEATQKWVAIQRVGSVDLGSLSWSKNTMNGNSCFFSNVLDSKSHSYTVVGNSLMANYRQMEHFANLTDADNKVYVLNSNAHAPYLFAIRDTSYTDATAFKAAMSGVMLYYELAEPIITTIEEPIQMDYWVEDFGTEEAISDTPSAPFKADVVYQFNAEGRIRDNSRNIERLEDVANEHTTAIEGKLSKPQVPPAQNSLLMWDGESMGIGDSGVGVAEQAADIANAVTDSVPTSAQVKEYVSGIAGPCLSFSDNLLGVVVDTDNFDHTNAQKVALNIATKAILNSAKTLTSFATISNQDLKIPNLLLTNGLISDNNLTYALPSAGDDVVGDADAVLASEGYVAEYMANNLPTEVATATQIEAYAAQDGSQLLYPNIMYEYPRGIGQSGSFVIPNIVQVANSTYDNRWMLRFPSIATSGVLTYPYAIKWKDGIAPNFTSSCTLEIYLKTIGTGEIIGEWKIYR